MRLGVLEIVLILVLALVLFGGKKLSGVGKALGQSIREFKNEVGNEDKAKEDDNKENQA
jgi:sec-independent protein translocase protein TatA